jgi:hypothetical protein
LALRTSGGVPAEALAFDPALEGLVEWGSDDGGAGAGAAGRAVLTAAGRMLANEVALRLR